MSAYVLLLSILLANLAWLLNPHACCPRPDEVCRCQQMSCPVNTEAVRVENMSETGCSENSADFQYVILRLSDQFSKGLTNDMPDTSPSSILLQSETDHPIFSAQQVNHDSNKYDSIVIPPIERPPSS